MQFENGLEQWARVDAHEHHTIAEPLCDPDAPSGTDVTQRGPEGREHGHRALVALRLGERGESRDVDEGEAAMYPHALMLPCACAAAQFGTIAGMTIGVFPPYDGPMTLGQPVVATRASCSAPAGTGA
jgi:hypothetical protein